MECEGLKAVGIIVPLYHSRWDALGQGVDCCIKVRSLDEDVGDKNVVNFLGHILIDAILNFFA
jgi:hypothetical protein